MGAALHRKQRIFVTGGGGFIGSAVVAYLAERDVPMSVLLGPPNEVVREPPAGVLSARADICDAEALAELARGCDVALHIAGPASVGGSFERPRQYIATHAEGTTAVLEACRRENIKRIVYISSAEIYGRAARQPVTEEQRPDPRSPYAAAKCAAEHVVRAFSNAFGMAACVLRPFSVYGPGQPPYAIVPTIVRQALEGEAIVLADVTPVRDYCFISDVVEAIALACELDRAGFTAFNVGTGVGTSVLQLARAAARESGRDIPIVTGAAATRPKEAEIYALIADITRSRETLRWQPKIALEAGLRRTAALVSK